MYVLYVYFFFVRYLFIFFDIFDIMVVLKELDSVNKKEKNLICIIAVLGLLVIGMGSYIVYDKVIGNDINENNNISADNDDMNNDVDNVGDKENLLSEEDAKLILKELEEKYYEYARVRNLAAYCGETDNNDYISFGSYETQDFRDYWASTEFKSISELREYFDDLMIDELKPNTLFDNGVSYIEKDGKLYCQLSHKDLAGDRDLSKTVQYSIVSIKTNSIVADVVFWANYLGYYDSIERDATITIIRNENGKWLVSDYKIKE